MKAITDFMVSVNYLLDVKSSLALRKTFNFQKDQANELFGLTWISVLFKYSPAKFGPLMNYHLNSRNETPMFAVEKNHLN